MSDNDMDVVAAASAMMSMVRRESLSPKHELDPPSSPPPQPKRQRLSALDAEVALLQQTALHIATLEQKNAALLHQVEQLQAHPPPTVLRVVNVTLVQRLRSDNESLRSALDKLRVEHTGLASAHNLSRQANASLITEITHLRTEKETAAAEIAKLVAQVAQLQRSVVEERLCAAKGRRRRVLWSSEETTALIQGVRAVYNPKQRDMDWTAVLAHSPILVQNGRLAVDLKDRWRNLERSGVIPIPMPRPR